MCSIEQSVHAMHATVFVMIFPTVPDDELACLCLKREALITAISALERLQISYSILIPDKNRSTSPRKQLKPPA